MSNESTVSVQVPAELQKIGTAIVGAVSDLKSGKTWQEVGVSILPAVLAEFGNLEEIKAEFSSDKLAPFIGLTLGAVAGFYLAKGAQAMLAKRKELKAKAPVVHAVDGAHEATVHA